MLPFVDSLPALRLADGRDFDEAAVFFYASRHSFAHRHADAGTPVDVLKNLIGHRSMSTTQLYYSVTAKRVRAAVDTLAAFQLDRSGGRVWRQARALLDSEHQRMAVGQVAVPFGACSEPSNVKAGGGACPFRFRCLGCGHFRTDPSYLPELLDYLDSLLQPTERIRSARDLDDRRQPSSHDPSTRSLKSSFSSRTSQTSTRLAYTFLNREPSHVIVTGVSLAWNAPVPRAPGCGVRTSIRYLSHRPN